MTFNSTHPQCLFASMDLGKPPGGLRSIQPFLTIYKQFIKRDPVVSYFALKHAVREGIQGINAPGRDAAVKAESKAYLTTLLDVLEEMKGNLRETDELSKELSNELVGATHVEEAGLHLFSYADKEDRSGNYHKNMVKAYFTSFHMFGIVKGLEELNEEIETKQKYAMWRAVEIDRCLKNGIQPTPPPEDTTPDAGGLSETKPTPKPRSFHPEVGVPPQPAGVTPSASWSLGTPSTSWSLGTPSASWSWSTPSASWSWSTPSASWSLGTPSASWSGVPPQPAGVPP
ncbi:Vacuolar protein sorting-associated protein VTA1 homolog [Geodia barretti]|uniref:Vacuolar protein sorting-associated protein VTA1 homolog n=1 Tax=Geodia barretti TaxID=519541 RepID=A0AA35RI18_GEOBA|nr:Vacuolar protein sorting-associated protein VTA1 homolog [Geodia barretti]